MAPDGSGDEYRRDRVKLEAACEFVKEAVKNANQGHLLYEPPEDKFKIKINYEICANARSTGASVGSLVFTVIGGDKKGFAEWESAMAAELTSQVTHMKEGWHTEQKGRHTWYVHPATQECLSYDPLRPLITLSHGNENAFYEEGNVKLEHGPSDVMAGDVRVRYDAIDDFLAPAGLTRKDLQLTEPLRAKAWRF